VNIVPALVDPHNHIGYTNQKTGVSSNGVLFTVTSSGPSISSLSLTQGPVGVTLTVNGSNFGITQGSSTVTFNGVQAIATANWSTASFDVTVPSGATTGNVVVTVGGVQSNGMSFTVTPPPNITSVSPKPRLVERMIRLRGTITDKVSMCNQGVVLDRIRWSRTRQKCSN